LGQFWDNQLSHRVEHGNVSRKGPGGSRSWQVKIRRREYPPQTRTFDSKFRAEEWVREVKHEMDQREHLREPLNTKALIALVGKNNDLVREAFFYMRDIDGWWSWLSNDFLLDPNSTVTINEQVVVYKSIGDLLARVYEWNNR